MEPDQLVMSAMVESRRSGPMPATGWKTMKAASAGFVAATVAVAATMGCAPSFRDRLVVGYYRCDGAETFTVSQPLLERAARAGAKLGGQEGSGRGAQLS